MYNFSVLWEFNACYIICNDKIRISIWPFKLSVIFNGWEFCTSLVNFKYIIDKEACSACLACEGPWSNPGKAKLEKQNEMIFVGRGGVKVMGMYFMSVWHVTALIKNKKQKCSNLQYCYLALHEKTQGISWTLKFCYISSYPEVQVFWIIFCFYKISWYYQIDFSKTSLKLFCSLGTQVFCQIKLLLNHLLS